MTPDIGRVPATARELLAAEYERGSATLQEASPRIRAGRSLWEEDEAALRAIETARASERAAVVAWLEDTKFGDDELDAASVIFAERIEQGKHQGGGE